MYPWKLIIITFYQDRHDNDKHREQLTGCGQTFDWALAEERLSITDWLGSVIFHLNGWRWQRPPLYGNAIFSPSWLITLFPEVWWGPAGPGQRFSTVCPGWVTCDRLSGHLSSGPIQQREQTLKGTHDAPGSFFYLYSNSRANALIAVRTSASSAGCGPGVTPPAAWISEHLA